MPTQARRKRYLPYRLDKANLPEGNCMLFVFVHNTLIGTGSFLIHPNQKLRHGADIVSVYIKPAYRGKGIGRALLQALIDEAKSYSFLENLVLTVTSTQAAAIALYESLGFIQQGVLPRNIKIDGTYYDQIIMV